MNRNIFRKKSSVNQILFGKNRYFSSMKMMTHGMKFAKN